MQEDYEDDHEEGSDGAEGESEDRAEEGEDAVQNPSNMSSEEMIELQKEIRTLRKTVRKKEAEVLAHNMDVHVDFCSYFSLDELCTA